MLAALISANNKANHLASSTQPSSVSVEAVKPVPASPQPFAAIADPSQEWMTAFKTIMEAASQSEVALLEPSMSRLVRLQARRSTLTAQQRASVRSHNVKGLAAFKASRFGDAGEDFLAAFEIDSTDSEVAENLGYALYKDGKIEPAIRALLQSLAAAPRRATAWGNLGGAYAHAGEQVQAVAAFSLSLRYAKSPSRTRSRLVSLYQEDPSEAVRSAVGSALASHYSSLVDPGLRDQLDALSRFPFSVLLPARMQLTNQAGMIASVYALNNSDFPIKADATEYSVWLSSDKDCRAQDCIVGRIAGSKSPAQTVDQGAVVDLAGGARGVLHKASEQQLAWLTIQRDGIVHSFSFGNESDLVSIANSALGLGPIPVSVFIGKPIGRQAQENAALPETAPQVSIPEATRSLVGVLTTSPKGTQLSSEQIYARASNSVVVVTVSDIQGSGVVVAPEIVVTNCHVAKEKIVTVHFRKAKYAAVVVAGNEDLDYCILKVAGLPAAPAPMGPLSDVAPGQHVYSLGSPQGLELTFAEGMVSALRPTTGMPLPIIQTTAPISHGSSGGGLFDQFGRVIGITTSFRVESQNLNFAMPVELYRYVIQAPVPNPRQAAPAVLPVPVSPQDAWQSQAPNGQPWLASTCNVEYNIDLQTFGENVSVELRNGAPGSSRIVGTQRSQGGRVSFISLCPGSYFVAIGNDDYVSVTPIRQFASDNIYTSRLTMQRGSGNVSKQYRKNL